MLKELKENDEACYPANTTLPPRKPDGYNRNASPPDRKGVGYIAHPANVEPYPDISHLTSNQTRAYSEKTQKMLTATDTTLE